MLFKKNKAITIDKMNVLDDVVVNEEKLKFTVQYSNISIPIEKVPGLLADIMQVYSLVKPALDQKSIEATKEQEKDKADDVDLEPIDLSDIPF